MALLPVTVLLQGIGWPNDPAAHTYNMRLCLGTYPVQNILLA